MKTFRLWLESDPDIPSFQRLNWEMIDVSISDVLLHGIHPWMGPDKHASLAEEFLKRMNADEAKVTNLVSMNYSNDVAIPYNYAGQKKSQFEHALDAIRTGVYFVSELTYMDLLNLAKEKLRGKWNNYVARTLLDHTYPRFDDLRRYLKGKRKDIKLAGRVDLDDYDLGKLLSLDDFEGRDSLLVFQGLPIQNFRRIGFLKTVTDAEGRLKLVDEVNNLVVYPLGKAIGGYTHSENHWIVRRKGTKVTFYPSLSRCPWWRPDAEALAKVWGTDGAKRVFETSVERLAEMVARGVAKADFSAIDYKRSARPEIARAEVAGDTVAAFAVTPISAWKMSGETLKDVLREYGVAMTGNKEQLIEKLAGLAARKYGKKLDEMNEYFGRNRFVRMASAPASAGRFGVLEDVRHIRDLLIAMYLLRHLRGAIVEAESENEAYSAEELAMALLRGQVAAGGAYLRVAG